MKLRWKPILALPLLIGLTGIWLLWPHGKPAAGWYNDDWQYRKKITVTNNTTTESNKYVTLSSFDTSDTTRFQSDCGDVRFVKANGEILPYYIVSGCGSASTSFHINFDSLVAGAQDIYIYYGNSTVANGFESADFSSAATNSSLGTPASEEQSLGAVLSWNMNESNGSTLNDDTLNANTGTLGTTTSAPTWINSDMCINGSCLKFDGTNDYVSRTYSTDTELNPGTSSFSVSAWFRHSSVQTGTDVIISRVDGANANGVGYKIFMDSSGYICFGIDQAAGSFPADSACSSAIQGSYADSKWHHVAGVKDTGTTKIYLYIDGQVITGTTYTAGSISGSSPAFRVGIDNGAANPWDGYIDAVKVYPYARTADQIETDFATRGTVQGVAVQMGNSENNKNLSSGLVAYWKMDENTGTTIQDSSGNQGTSSTFTGNTSFSSGKFGTGLTFDGTDDVVRIPENSSTDRGALTDSYTVSAWFKSTGTTAQVFLGKESGTTPYPYRLYVWGNMIFFDIYADSQIQATSDPSIDYSDGNWHLATGVRDAVTKKILLYVDGVLRSTITDTSTVTAANNADVSLGNSGTSYTQNDFKGELDEVRIYNRALSSSEVTALYNWEPGPIGYWKLDENQGNSTINDYSGNSNVGTVTVGTEFTWEPGKMGQSVYFANSKANAYGAADDIAKGGLTFSAYFKLRDTFNSSTTTSRYIYYLGNTDGSSTNDANLYLGGTDDGAPDAGKVKFCIYTGAALDCTMSSQNSWSPNLWYHVEGVFNPLTGATLYVNGVLSGSSTNKTRGTTASTEFKIGANWVSNQRFYGNLDELKVYNYPRTQSQIIEDMNGGHPMGGSPVGSQIGYWKFDEGYGDTANNTISGNSNGDLGTTTCPGSVTCPTWTMNGKFNNALTFDGSNTQVQMANNAYTDTQGSISAWIKLAVLPSDGTAFSIYTSASSSSSTNFLSLDVYDPPGLTPRLRIGSRSDLSFLYGDTALTTGVWYHVAAVSDGSAWSTYVNGRKQTLTIQSGTGAGSGHWFSQEISGTMQHTVGALRRSTGTINYFNGTIDEVKIYNAPLTDDEVKIDYNRGAIAVMGYTSTASDGITADTSGSREYCVPGDTTSCNAPLIDFKFDENTGATATYDTSGNGYTGAFNGTMTGANWTTGKQNSTILFDTTDDNVTISNASALVPTRYMTISAWVMFDQFNGTDQRFIRKFCASAVCGGNSSYILELDGPTVGIRFHVHTGGGAGSLKFAATANNAVVANTWYHITGVYNDTGLWIYINGVNKTSTLNNPAANVDGDSNVLRFGAHTTSSSPLLGKMDRVLLYDYARTPAQIAWDYNHGGPVAHYKLDECSGTTAYNSVLDGNGQAIGNNGTISIGATGANTSAGTCTGAATEAWKNGANGKFGSSLDFDGTDDFITTSAMAPSAGVGITYPSGSWGGWFYPKTSAASKTLMEKATEVRITTDASSNAICGIYYAGAFHDATAVTAVLSLNTWNHVQCTTDGTNIKTYLNGRLVNTTADNHSIVSTSSILYIAENSSSAQRYKGQIDEIRIYNYPLTLPQIQLLYNNAASVNFVPITGSP